MHKKISVIKAGECFTFHLRILPVWGNLFRLEGKRKINCFIFEVVAGTKSNKWVYKRPGSV